MNGMVATVNPTRGMVAVLTNDGDYSILEMLGDDPPEIGDRFRWQGDSPLGGETVENLTQNITYEVFFQNHQVGRPQVPRQLLLE